MRMVRDPLADALAEQTARGFGAPGEKSHAERHIDPELLLGGRDRPECLAQVHASERGQILRIDDVVRGLAPLDAGCVVVEPDAGDHLERLTQGGCGLGAGAPTSCAATRRSSVLEIVIPLASA